MKDAYFLSQALEAILAQAGEDIKYFLLYPLPECPSFKTARPTFTKFVHSQHDISDA